jgi:DNA (cytosine-5)-methyltransferase 1
VTESGDRITDQQPTVIDLFSGCGGGSMGFLRAGFQIRTAVEIDENASASFEENLGVQPITKAIRQVDGRTLLRKAKLRRGECTLVFGCPPCHRDEARRCGDLERPKTQRAARRLRAPRRRIFPHHIAFENVPELLAGRWVRRFAKLLTALRAAGYRLIHGVVDAADFGVPQHRRRLLVVGSRVTEPIMPKPTHTRRAIDGFLPHVTVREAIGGLQCLEAGKIDPADSYHRARRHSELNLRRLRAVPEGGGRRDLPLDLQLACHKDHNGHYDVYGRMWWDRPAPTLTSGCNNITRGRFGHPEQDRAITIREAMRWRRLARQRG